MMKSKNKIILGISIAVLLILAFCCGGDVTKYGEQKVFCVIDGDISAESSATKSELSAITDDLCKSYDDEKSEPGHCKDESEDVEVIEEKHKNTDNTSLTSVESTVSEQSVSEHVGDSVDVENASQKNDTKVRIFQGMLRDESTGTDKYMTEPIPEGKPLPIEPQDVVITDKEYTCTLSVRCDTVLKNIEWLDKEKFDIVPKNGIIFAEKTVKFYDGESVFNLLIREMKLNKIHMEFVNTPIYNSAYIEGIGNLYEFDCGELSGWMYRVNGWFPNYGCSRYRLNDGDRVEWVYTCDLGKDVEGYYSFAQN